MCPNFPENINLPDDDHLCAKLFFYNVMNKTNEINVADGVLLVTACAIHTPLFILYIVYNGVYYQYTILLMLNNNYLYTYNY